MTPLTWIRGVGGVAVRYGMEEAVLLDSMIFWWRTARAENRNYKDGRWWTYNSVKGLSEIFPWWSDKQLRRILNSCVEQGALLEGNYNEQARDRTKWYSPGDELLALYGEAEATKKSSAQTGNCICPNGQMDLPERADAIAQMGEPLPCNTTCTIPPYSPPEGGAHEKRKREVSAPKWKPDMFERFWALYPRGDDRKRAVKAWDKLKPDDELMTEMSRSLKRQMASEQWQRNIGIPYASTWLNNERWKDEAKAAATALAQPPPKSRPYHIEIIDGEEVMVRD